MAYKLKGNWSEGIAYDLHTVSSEYLGQDEYGHDQYSNTRSEMGELVYKLKYKNDLTAVSKIVDLLQTLIKRREGLDSSIVVPIPPSNINRAIQPVFLVATEFGKRFNLVVCLDGLEKSKGSQELKSIQDPREREKVLRDTMQVSNKPSLYGKSILLIDDLFRSGSTLKVATDLLYSEAAANKVRVLTMTKTRKNK